MLQQKNQNLHNNKTLISLEQKNISQKEKRHFTLLLLNECILFKMAYVLGHVHFCVSLQNYENRS